ncbi:MAG: aldo/keto reductase [Rhodospirillales bacterium]|jgi:aryl-alcohol dehydrogenase-like predicted oxidoreductase|nr:aldo/keto reductase [Rhodospirillales bacterium]MDP6883321.1 aldo/keto reductase [Rhodospirillales bacterium]
MDYRRLGRSGLLVSPICLGTAKFGDRVSEVTARRLVAMAREAGVNFIDTADKYVLGRSETMVGKIIRRDRDRWVLATKVGLPWDEAPNRSGLGRKWIMEQLEASLRRLGTDYVDLYYLHRDDPDTPLEETVAAMGDIVRQGKARYIGLSNLAGWRISQYVALADHLGLPRPIACQPYYNALNRMAEVEVLPACGHFGLGVVPFSPLSAGVLTGKYRPDAPPPPSSRVGAGDPRMMQVDYRDESLRLTQVIKAHAEARGMTVVDFALNWVLNSRHVTSVIAGPRTAAQWRAYMGALKHPFSAEDEALIDGLVASGHPSTPGYNDPQYPPTGRRPRTNPSD